MPYVSMLEGSLGEFNSRSLVRVAQNSRTADVAQDHLGIGPRSKMRQCGGTTTLFTP